MRAENSLLKQMCCGGGDICDKIFMRLGIDGEENCVLYAGSSIDICIEESI